MKDKSALEARREIKRIFFRELFKNHKTYNSMAEELNMTIQALRDNFVRLGLITEWKNHTKKIKSDIFFSEEKSVLYSLFFKEEPLKRYYGSTKNLRHRLYIHIQELRKGLHYCKNLQEMFLKYGELSLTYDIIKYVPPDRLLIEEAEIIKNDLNCLNKVNPFLGIGKYKNNRREYLKKYNSLKRNLLLNQIKCRVNLN
jgi:hypothetical protein